MKNTVLILTVLFSTAVSSSPVHAEWTKLTTSVIGDTTYLDYERIRKYDGYSYSWELVDNLKPTKTGNFSFKAYKQIDCDLFRFKVLSLVGHKQPMGQDIGLTYNPENPEWEYPEPTTISEATLTAVCSH